ncbi:hypothetical protein L1049_011002 [Liquidambar formosana]|uniref:BHLH domain-containing protein n=1 Tax=Liquidambar formosana TaxID=63359 RepID=A0AAP0RW12_LIQFO
MSSVQNGNWRMEEFQGTSECISSAQPMSDQKITSARFWPDVPLNNENSAESTSSKKRARIDSSAGTGTKACREKMRRDRLNDRFLELCSILVPERPPNTDKVVILTDAARLLNQLHSEAKKLKERNESLQDSIRSLKLEKMELREEKLKLKSEKERTEQLVKGMSIPSSFCIASCILRNCQQQDSSLLGKLSTTNVAMGATCIFGYFSGPCPQASCCLSISP